MSSLTRRRANFSDLLRQAFLVLACMATWFGIAAAGIAANGNVASPEYAIKAAFLFKFGAFVEWPAIAFSSANAPLVIGILGEDPFGAALDTLVRGRTINGRPVSVIRGERIDQMHGEHILFISRSEQLRMEAILAALEGKNILTVAEFGNPDIVIQFIVESDKVRFDINLAPAHRFGLQLSSKLLSVARTINGK